MAEKQSSPLIVVDHPLIESKLTTLRQESTPPPQFRQALYELSFLLAFPVTAHLHLTEVEIMTPLEPLTARRLTTPPPCIVSILRAGNGLADGFSQVCPEASIGHLGLYRDHDTAKPVSYYTSLPDDIAARQVILCDPMLATGGSAIMAVDKLHDHGVKDIVFACLVAAPEGVKALHDRFPDLKVFTASLDRELNDKFYILPGLGDAGDRIYGTT